MQSWKLDIRSWDSVERSKLKKRNLGIKITGWWVTLVWLRIYREEHSQRERI